MLHAASISFEAITKSEQKKSANKYIDAHNEALNTAVIYKIKSASRLFSEQKENFPFINVDTDFNPIRSKDLSHYYGYYLSQITTKKKSLFSTTVDGDDSQHVIDLILENLQDNFYLTPDKPISPNVTIHSLTVTMCIKILDIPFAQTVQPASFISDIKPKLTHRTCNHTSDQSLESWRNAVSKAYNLSPVESAYVFFKPYCNPQDTTSKRIAEAIAMRSTRK
ncbi:hypothetical protein G7B40_031025 [Aetokthonos hydrillicola Thurmond2011]|jgi:hypothetical protein|uniref:Uncharacterized protein n=1 Tax=Aetokthonos hydrillicola Thurmond2011 TaxID=2712845 RepID=A0AAP5ICF4_9CYAN|nr:hypothetical protein [Aetokthonos hydrillicola]MBO3462110.1 hypothetical protein [Aetokthonos hydrillicola CCALA 1050]MBW4589704.1 hypothetical protein [Aetokthonos hydrillicola CCALA 1050]MDR9898958.1 hypothetical protein [Aetokthonos hydrillicola Thurmond2011]